MKSLLKWQCMFSVLHSQYHAGWCSGDLMSQCINRHGIDPWSWNIPFPASEELTMIMLTLFLCFLYRIQNMKIIDGKPEYKGAVVSLDAWSAPSHYQAAIPIKSICWHLPKLLALMPAAGFSSPTDIDSYMSPHSNVATFVRLHSPTIS